jgi:phospholipid/cholesterol/gamma-HCH transport system substrate-binding protein
LSRSLTRMQAAVLGAVVLLGLALGVIGLFAAGSRHWLPDAFHIRAGFADVGGVEPGTRVRVQGIDAGEVEAVEPPGAPGGEVTLRLRVAGKYRPLVTADSQVEIAGDGLLGGKVVRILPGNPAAGPAGDNALLRGKQGSDLAQATARLNTVLAEAEIVVAGVREGKGTVGKLVRDEKLYNELTATLGEVKAALNEVRGGEGTVGMLVKSNEAYTEAIRSLQEVRGLVASVRQNSDAIKALPVVRSYVVDVNKELIRPDSERHRKWYDEAALFQPGKAVLTDRGRGHLDEAAAWMNGHKEDRSEVVVAAFASHGHNPDFAQTLTQKQAEVVVEYLRSNHGVHRMGFLPWDNRHVRAIGCGVNGPPVPEKEKLPSARVELLVFVPQN